MIIFGNNDSAYVDQLGERNTSYINQGASNALADVWQDGAENASGISQGEQSDAYVTQLGENGRSTITQTFGETATVKQTSLSVNAISTIVQNGAGHTAVVSQYSGDNSALVTQAGTGNTAS
ncbi:hypothetical protein [Allosphingosinicella deserti]|uniref:hypothetical protein n=1 Tax=Allosphingosinicella deserti TaxID=2116704 RepID=UPI001304E14E|nr:hypothetical protein [Sphingomonas deserti]